MKKIEVWEVGPEEFKELLTEVVRKVVREELDKTDFGKTYPELLTSKEVSKIMKISLQTLDSWVKEGRLQKYRINKRVFFKKKEVYDALKKVQNDPFSN